VITSVTIEGFRGVREGGVEGLAPISILVGPNNTGKSTVLEALGVLGLGDDARGVAHLLMRRGGPPLHALARTVWHEATEASLRASVSLGIQVEKWVTNVTFGGLRTIEHLDQARHQGLEETMTPVGVEVTRGAHRAHAKSYVDTRGKQSFGF
jgi:predicted ATPase